MSLQHADRQGLCAARLHRGMGDAAGLSFDALLLEAGYCLDAPQALPSGSHLAPAPGAAAFTALSFRDIP